MPYSIAIKRLFKGGFIALFGFMSTFWVEAGHAAAPLPAEVVGVPTAVDGDTLLFGIGKVSLKGLDAPEMKTARGPVARAAMDDLIAGKRVRCEIVERDHYKRLVGWCEVEVKGGVVDLSEAMIRSGYGFVYRQYAADRLALYDAAERMARDEGAGFWELSKKDSIPWPAWIQAIGSVIAIIFGVWFSNREHRRSMIFHNLNFNEEKRKSLYEEKKDLVKLGQTSSVVMPRLVDIRFSAKAILEYFEKDSPDLTSQQKNKDILENGIINIDHFYDGIDDIAIIGQASFNIQGALEVVKVYNKLIDYHKKNSLDLDEDARTSLQSFLNKAIDYIDTSLNLINSAIEDHPFVSPPPNIENPERL